METIALRKLIAGILVLLIASGVIKWEMVNNHRWLKLALYIMGFLLVFAAILYQLEMIPASSQDMLLK